MFRVFGDPLGALHACLRAPLHYKSIYARKYGNMLCLGGSPAVLRPEGIDRGLLDRQPLGFGYQWPGFKLVLFGGTPVYQRQIPHGDEVDSLRSCLETVKEVKRRQKGIGEKKKK